MSILSPEDLKLLHLSLLGDSFLGDFKAREEFTRRARRRGETLVVFYDRDGEVIERLDPNEWSCTLTLDEPFPCGGCWKCAIQMAQYSGIFYVDCSPRSGLLRGRR